VKLIRSNKVSNIDYNYYHLKIQKVIENCLDGKGKYNL